MSLLEHYDFPGLDKSVWDGVKAEEKDMAKHDEQVAQIKMVCLGSVPICDGHLIDFLLH